MSYHDDRVNYEIQKREEELRTIVRTILARRWQTPTAKEQDRIKALQDEIRQLKETGWPVV